MIYEKSAHPFADGRRLLPCKPAELKALGSVHLINFKQQDGALVEAHRFETVRSLDEQTISLFAAADTVYAGLNSGCVRDLSTNKIHITTFTVSGIVTYCSTVGEHTDYIFGEKGNVHAVRDGEVLYFPDLGKAKVGAVFRERLYLAMGSRLSYSAPLAPEKFLPTEEDAGQIDLSDLGGDILALVPYGDRLLVFRSYEILKLRADANDLNFAFSKVKFDGGEIAAGSVQSCGRLVVFRTECGLWTFDGERCKRLEVEDESVTFLSPAVSAAHGGRYYTRVKYNTSNCLLAVDPENGECFYVSVDPQMLAGNEKGLWFNSGGTLFHVGGSGSSAINYSSLVCDIDLSAKWAGYVLEGVTVGGQGSFTVTVQANGGTRKDYKATANEMTSFRHTLPTGRLFLNILTYSKDAAIREVVFHLREVGK